MSLFNVSMKWLKDVTSRSLVLLFLSASFVSAQDTNYVRSLLDTLCSEAFFGRGYVNDGYLKAANFLADEMKFIGLKPIDEDYLLPFQFDVNTIVGNPELFFDDKQLEPAVDYLIDSQSSSTSGDFSVVLVNEAHLLDQKKLKKVISKGLQGKVLMIDTRKADKDGKDVARFLKHMNVGASAVIEITSDKLTWGMSQKEMGFGVLTVKVDDSFEVPKQVQLSINNNYLKQTESFNIAGYIPGKLYPDSFIVFSAHYDHLGGMGEKVFFPGANDNGSGTSLIMDMARHLVQEDSLKYSVVFILFGAEEVGLVGSYDFVEKEHLPLEQIKLVINTDIMGTGDEGIKVVNATNNMEVYETMVGLNDERQLLKVVGKRGPAANSDHHPFHEKGVPAIFIYTMGGIQAYHDIYDVSRTLPLTKYNEVFQLIEAFVWEDL